MIETNEQKIKRIEEIGASAKGKKELVAFLEGKPLSAKQTVLADCYDCQGFYADGREDCENKQCVAYPYMPYNPNKTRHRKQMTDEQKQKAGERMKLMRGKKKGGEQTIVAQ